MKLPIACLLVASLSGLTYLQGQVPASTTSISIRTISADYQTVKGPKSEVYRYCVGAGRVAEGLRAEWQDQLRTCQEKIGFEYLRCHGVFSDDLGVYSEDVKGNPVYNWQYVDMVYDFLLSIHVRPFVEISFMPDALASKRVPIFWWKGNAALPKSWDKWDALVTAVTRHWTDRYGADEVKQWYFEIWNEPDGHYFFTPVNEATRESEYFNLYNHTAKAVKSVNAAYRVGGPAGSGSAWVKDLIPYCVGQNVPLDFITYHIYGLGGGPGGLDNTGQVKLYLDTDLEKPAHGAHREDANIAQSALPHLPVHITEWSSAYSSYDPIHDSYFQAPYILEQLKHTETLSSMSYWTFTDIFEEAGPQKKPFRGGFGLINLQGIKKPAFFAYQFLNELGPEELKNADEKAWVCRDSKGGVQALFWDLTDPRPNLQISDQDIFGNILVPSPKPPVKLHLTSLPPGPYHLAIHRIGYKENDAYSAYLKMGTPSQLTPSQVGQLKDTAAGKPAEERDVTVAPSGTWESEFSMRDNEVVFVKLTPQK